MVLSSYSRGQRLVCWALLTSVLTLSCGGADAARKHAAVQAEVGSQAPKADHVVTPYLVMDVASGRVIEERASTRPWYPASVTKLMTVYVTLQAVKQGRLSLDTPLVVSARAARMQPSKMGFAPGSLVTVDNALKMLMVKSANDLAVTVAEGVSGSVEAFADEMNEAAASLGMQESHFVNPNGLADPRHVSSARDMALLGRALLVKFPQHADLFNIGAFKIGEQVVPTHNGLIGRYPGADGMKTGFTCPAGFNLVASATRDSRKVIVVVMGDPSARVRTAHAANLLDRAFSTTQFGENAAELPSIGGAPPNMRSLVCGRRNKNSLLAAETEDLERPIQGAENAAPLNGAAIAALPRPVYAPIDVFVGPVPGYQGPVAGPRPANTPIGAIAYAPPEKAAPPPPPALPPDPKANSMRKAKAPAHRSKAPAHLSKAAAKVIAKVIARHEEKKPAHPAKIAHKAAPTLKAKAKGAHKSEGDGK